MPDIWLAIVSPEDDAVKLGEILQLPSQSKVIILVTKM